MCKLRDGHKWSCSLVPVPRADGEVRPLTFQTPGAIGEAPAWGLPSAPRSFLSLREVRSHSGVVRIVCKELDEVVNGF